MGDLIKWNFEKFLVDKNGKVVERYPPTTSPFQIEVCGLDFKVVQHYLFPAYCANLISKNESMTVLSNVTCLIKEVCSKLITK